MAPLDRYTYRARVQPALVVVLPIGLWAFAWVLDVSVITGVLVSAGGTGGGAALLAQMGRDRGRGKQADLWKSWGGPPTTQLLRFQGAANRSRLRQWRAGVERVVGYPLPTEEEELDDREAADDEYEAAIRALRVATLDRRNFPLVFAENVNYGFRRNLWGWKAVGLPAAVVGALGAWGLFLMSAGIPPGEAWVDSVLKSPDEATAIRLVASILNTLLTAGWVFAITPGWVKVAAEAYAERLLDTFLLPDVQGQ